MRLFLLAKTSLMFAALDFRQDGILECIFSAHYILLFQFLNCSGFESKSPLRSELEVTTHTCDKGLFYSFMIIVNF